VRVGEARQDRAAGDMDALGGCIPRGHVGRGTQGGDPVVVHDEGGVGVDRVGVVGGDDRGAVDDQRPVHARMVSYAG